VRQVPKEKKSEDPSVWAMGSIIVAEITAPSDMTIARAFDLTSTTAYVH
jgi:hypothetical protein